MLVSIGKAHLKRRIFSRYKIGKVDPGEQAVIDLFGSKTGVRISVNGQGVAITEKIFILIAQVRTDRFGFYIMDQIIPNQIVRHYIFYPLFFIVKLSFRPNVENSEPRFKGVALKHIRIVSRSRIVFNNKELVKKALGGVELRRYHSYFFAVAQGCFDRRERNSCSPCFFIDKRDILITQPAVAPLCKAVVVACVIAHHGV